MSDEANPVSFLEDIKKIVADMLGIDVEKVTPEANVIDDLGADSLDTVELIMEIEEAFEIEISDADAEAMTTIADIVAFLDKKRSAAT